MLEFVRGLYEPRTPEGLSEHLVYALPELVHTRFAASGLIEMGTAVQARTARANPPEFAQLDATVSRYVSESPIVVHFERTRSEQFARWSDLQPLPQFLRSELYNAAYRPAGIRDCCTLLFNCGPNCREGIGVGLHKRIPDAHRDILVSISPHLVQALRLAHTNSALIEMAAMKSGANCAGRGLMAIDLSGTITMETAGATRLLEKFFGKRTMRGLPDQLAQWISHSDEKLRKATDLPNVRRPLVIQRAESSLAAHLFSKPDQNFIVLEEHCWAVDPAALSSLRLTRRESEILAYVAVGKTSREIGIILGVSSRTVEKHMEHILERLGVETRTAAAAAAFEAANL